MPRSLNLHLQAFPCKLMSPMASSFIQSNKCIYLLLFHNYYLTLQGRFFFSSSSFRPSNSKTSTTVLRFTSILALIFRTSNQQRQQQQNVRLCQTSLATLISCHRKMRKHIFRLCNNVIGQCFLVWASFYNYFYIIISFFVLVI